MVNTILSYLKFGNKFSAIEQTTVDNEDFYYSLTLKKKKKKLEIQNSLECNNIDEIKSSLKKNQPVVLVINTNSVLTKRIESSSKELTNIVHSAFPNIKIEDFYYEILSHSKNHFISICRKSYVNELIENYTSKHIMIIDFHLGNLALSTIVSFINKDSIISSNAITHLEDHQIKDIQKSKNPLESKYNINGLDMTNKELLSFSAALNLVTNSSSNTTNFDSCTKKLSDDFNQKQFFNQFSKIGLSAIFIVLLINFLFFNHYYNEVNTLRETALMLESSKTNMLMLSEKVQKTEKTVNDVLKSSASKSSFYVNDIVANLPNHILLSALNYQPLLKKIKVDKPIENDINTILLSGRTNKKILFSQWISQLETLDWIYSVDILNFDDIDNSSSEFNLKITLRNDSEK